MNTDTSMEQCSVCKVEFKRRGLKIHQTKAGCAKQLSDSHRNKNKSEATSTQDTNHSDANGRVCLKTTQRGKGAKVTGAMENNLIEVKKMAGETCNEGEMVAKGKLSGLENTKVREEKSDIRNWFKKKDQFKKENIQQIKSEEDKVTEAELIDISEEDKVSGVEISDLSAIIDQKNVEAGSSRQEKVKEKVDIQRGPSDEWLNKRLDLRRYDFQSLSGSRYLNDKIIDQYLRLIRERNEADSSLPGIYTCITQVFSTTKSRGVRHTRWWVKEDLRMKDLILFPIHN